jgi:hypothetical protein
VKPDPDIGVSKIVAFSDIAAMTAGNAIADVRWPTMKNRDYVIDFACGRHSAIGTYVIVSSPYRVALVLSPYFDHLLNASRSLARSASET